MFRKYFERFECFQSEEIPNNISVYFSSHDSQDLKSEGRSYRKTNVFYDLTFNL
jgi:hypothetical protein